MSSGQTAPDALDVGTTQWHVVVGCNFVPLQRPLSSLGQTCACNHNKRRSSFLQFCVTLVLDQTGFLGAFERRTGPHCPIA